MSTRRCETIRTREDDNSREQVQNVRGDSSAVRRGTVPVRKPALSRLTAVEDTQHHESIAVVAILKNVCGAQDFQDQLPVLLASRERPAKLRMSRENLRSGDDLASNDLGKLGRLVVKKCRESIEVGESVVRPFEIY